MFYLFPLFFIIILKKFPPLIFGVLAIFTRIPRWLLKKKGPFEKSVAEFLACKTNVIIPTFKVCCG